MENLTDFFSQFEEWILKDIRQILKLEDEQGNLLEPDRSTQDYHRPFVAAVILTCCAIDVLAAFRYGKEKNDVGETFKCFLRNYFIETITKSKKSYNVDDVYNGLRNALLHGYSLNNDLALSHDDEGKHLNRTGNYITVDVFMFYYDLEQVYKKYKEELRGGKHISEFNRRYVFAPLIRYIPEENLKR